MTNRAPARTLRALSWVVLLLGIVYFTFRGPIFPNGNRLWDYAVCASSSYLWVHGEDPFAWEAVKASWLDRGGAPGITPDIKWLYAIVPPTTLAVLAPFAALPVAVGAYLYLCVTTALTGVAAWLCGRWGAVNGGVAWRFYAAAILFSVPATLGLFSGNPTMLATPLLLIGSYLIATRKAAGHEWIGGALVGLGVATKIQMGLPILALWIVIGRWRPSLAAVVVAAGVGVISIGRLAAAEVDWLAPWIENVRQTTTEGGLNDFLTAKNPDDLLNLQVGAVRLLRDRAMTESATFALWLALGAATLGAMLRCRWRLEGLEPWLLGIVGLLTLIPVYHRTYDAIVLLPLLALVVSHVSAGRLPGWSWTSLFLMGSLLVPAGLPNFLFRRGWVPPVEEFGVVSSLVYGHKGWCILILAALTIWTFWRVIEGRRDHLSQKNPAAATGVA